jgi:hypothetical protein
MTSIEVWIAMNEDGDYEVAKDEDDVVDLWNENVGGLSRRLVKLRVTMSAPVVTEADVNVPALLTCRWSPSMYLDVDSLPRLFWHIDISLGYDGRGHCNPELD